MSEEYVLRVQDKPTFSELIIERGLNAYNKEHGFDPAEEIAVFLYDDAGTVQGGAQGETQWGWLYVDLLWLDPDMRGVGHGRQVMNAIEQGALARGCAHTWLATTDFQALPFYEHIGYQVVGQLEDRPPGHHYYFLQKRFITPIESHLTATADPEVDQVSVVRRGLASHNLQQGAEANGQRLAVFLEDHEEGLHGGLIAATYWGWLDIQAMWIRDVVRGRGYGARMLAKAEVEAKKRGCPHAFVDVASFQALDFFQAQGYVTFATLQDRPPGYTTHFMRKSL